MKKIFILAAACVALFSCKEPVAPTPDPTPDAIVVSPQSATFEENGGTIDVTVTSTGNWTLTPAADYDWVDASALTGANGDKVTFTVASNFEADKKADFTFATGEEGKTTCTFSVFSYAGHIPAVTLISEAAVDFTYEAGQLEIIVSTEATEYTELEYEVSEGAEWLAYQATLPGDEADTDAKLYFGVEALEGLEDRTATVTVSAEGLTPAVVTVTQYAKHVLSTPTANYTVAVEGETIIVPVTANVEYKVEMEGAEGWLTVGEATAEGVPFTAAALESGKRSATVTFTQTDAVAGEEALVCTIKITQVSALISWAADMTGNRLFPKWDGQGGPGVCDTFTLETLVKFDDFNKGNGGIFTIMGVEGVFLLRMGDVGNALNCLQVATRGGNYNCPFECEANTWYHIAVVWENRIAKVYFDGELKGESQQFDEEVYVGWPYWSYFSINPDLSPAWSYEPDGNRCFWIGYSYDNQRDTHGLMTEIRIWKKALSVDELNAENHFYTVDPASEGLYSYWKFTEGEGETVADATGRGNSLYGEVDIEKQSNGDNSGPAGIEWVEVALPDK